MEKEIVRHTAQQPGEGAFSPDGYAVRQDAFSNMRYRNIDASINGCGFIAAYNLLRFLGDPCGVDEVREELDSMMPRFPGPTYMRTMRAFLKRHAVNYREYHGRRECAAQARNSTAGIFRYYEERIPHFITYIRQGKDFRFFNVNDGLEDFTSSMEDFASAHFVFGPVSLLCVTAKGGAPGKDI